MTCNVKRKEKKFLRVISGFQNTKKNYPKGFAQGSGYFASISENWESRQGYSNRYMYPLCSLNFAPPPPSSIPSSSISCPFLKHFLPTSSIPSPLLLFEWPRTYRGTATGETKQVAFVVNNTICIYFIRQYMYIILLFFCEKIISSSLHNIQLAKRKGKSKS